MSDKAQDNTEKEPILEMIDVQVDYPLDEGLVRAVRGASYKIYPDETLALVGESGCGKSQSSYAAIGLIQPPGITSGSILYHSAEDGVTDLLTLDRNSRQMREIRGGDISMIFQEPMTALSPVHRIGHLLDEVLKLHTTLNKQQRFEHSCELLTQVGIPDADKRYFQYSFEFSGGMRQRIMIAIALACNPKVLFADEPTTGLDVTIQAQIMELISELQSRTKMAVVLITHDLAVVAENADRVAVMYLGRIVELADVETIFHNPRHPYTVALMKSVIGSPLASDGKLHIIRGSVPPPLAKVPGCAFHPRCDSFIPGVCDVKEPNFDAVDGKTMCACHLYAEKSENGDVEGNAENAAQ